MKKRYFILILICSFFMASHVYGIKAYCPYKIDIGNGNYIKIKIEYKDGTLDRKYMDNDMNYVSPTGIYMTNVAIFSEDNLISSLDTVWWMFDGNNVKSYLDNDKCPVLYYTEGNDNTKPRITVKDVDSEVTDTDSEGNQRHDSNSSNGSSIKKDDDTSNSNLTVTEVKICSDNNSLKVFRVIGYILIIIKILVPLVLIVMGSIDFAKAALSGDDKATQNAALKLGKRTILGLAIFFIPTILDFFLSIVSDVNKTMGKYESCTSCIFNPNDSDKCKIDE